MMPSSTRCLIRGANRSPSSCDTGPRLAQKRIKIADPWNYAMWQHPRRNIHLDRFTPAHGLFGRLVGTVPHRLSAESQRIGR